MSRGALGDRRLRPVENLATNPSFEQATSGTTTIRRNRVLNPSLASADTGWSAYVTGGTATFSRVAENFADAPAFGRATTTSAGVGSLYIISGSVNGAIPVVGGRTYTASLYGRPSWATQTKVSIEWWSAANAWISSDDSISQAHAAGVIERKYVTATAPVGATWAKIIFKRSSGIGAAPSLGDTLDASKALIEERLFLLPYFDGSTASSLGLNYSWEGTPDASASIVKTTVIEFRRNLTNIPAPGASNGAAFPTSAPTSTETTLPPVNTVRFWRATHDGSITNIGFDSLNGEDPSVTVGLVITRSAWVRLSRATTLLPSPINAAATGMTALNAPPVAVPANVWTRVFYTGTVATAGRLGLRLRASGTTFVAGDTIDVGALLTENSPIVNDYFDGNLSTDSDLAPSWTGSDGTSPSVVNGVKLEGVSSHVLYKNIRSSQWQLNGSTSLRMSIANTATEDTFASIDGDVGAMRLSMQPGSTYTAIATVRLSAPLTGTLATNSRRLVAYYKNAGSYIQFRSTQPPNSAGTYTLRFAFTIPTTATEAFVRLYHGGYGFSGDVWWDNFALFEGDYSGSYIDGDMPQCIWRGVAHASKSVGRPSLLS